jgi:predicted nucleic acid-binding protein
MWKRRNMLVLDTSALIELVENGKRSSAIYSLITEDTGITTVTLHEFGVKASKEHFDRVAALPILSYDEQSALASIQVEQELRKAGNLIGAKDIFIAGTCIAHNATLITCDKAFKRVPKLKVKVV